MNKIEKLIQEYCPDGVEYKELGEVSKISRGRVISKEYIRKNVGYYPVYSSQTENEGILGKINTYEYDGEYITWTTDGANAGSIFHRNGKFNITNVCGLLEINSISLNVKFLTYWLDLVAKLYVSEGMGNPKLMSNTMSKIQVPIPPLPVQQEIVSILDKFTQLEEELNAELEARRKQYNFYLNQLMGFEIKDVEWSKISEIGKCFAGATPKTSVNAYWENGTIPWMSSGEVNSGNIYETEKKITKLGFDNSSTKMIPSNSVVIALAGQGKTRGTVAITRIPLCTNQSLCAVVTGGRVNSDFLYYYLKTQYSKLSPL